MISADDILHRHSGASDTGITVERSVDYALAPKEESADHRDHCADELS